MLINVDLTQVPDQRPQIPSGIYLWKINKVEDKEPSKPESKGKGMTLHVDLEIVQSGNPEIDGRKMTHYVWIPFGGKFDDYVQVRRLFLSAGIDIQASGMNTASLVGRFITASAVSSIQDVRGVKREVTNIGDVYIPADNVKPGQAAPGGGQVASAADVSAVLGGGATQQPVPTPAPSSPMTAASILGLGQGAPDVTGGQPVQQPALPNTGAIPQQSQVAIPQPGQPTAPAAPAV